MTAPLAKSHWVKEHDAAHGAARFEAAIPGREAAFFATYDAAEKYVDLWRNDALEKLEKAAIDAMFDESEQ